MDKIIEKAGAILLRKKNGKKEILLAHRTREFNDWSFPKGHIDPGETPEIAAKREIREETGLEVTLIDKLPVIFYNSGEGAVKQYTFLAKATGGTLRHNYENDKLRWVTPKEAERKLSYQSLKDLIKNIEIPT